MYINCLPSAFPLTMPLIDPSTQIKKKIKKKKFRNVITEILKGDNLLLEVWFF